MHEPIDMWMTFAVVWVTFVASFMGAGCAVMLNDWRKRRWTERLADRALDKCMKDLMGRTRGGG